MDEEPVYHKEIFERIDKDKQNRIIRASAEEFAEKGFTAANINLIAADAGVSIGSLYKYFESKNHLYLEVVNRGLKLIESAISPVMASDLSLGEKVRGMIDAVYQGAREYPLMNRLYCRFTAEGDSDLARSLAVSLETVSAEAYSALMAQAKSDGLVDADFDERAAAFFMDNLFLTLQFSLSSEYWKDRMDIYLGKDLTGNQDALKEQMASFIFRALGISEKERSGEE